MAKEKAKVAAAKPEKPMAIQWAALIDLIMKIIEIIMSKKQAGDVRAALTDAAREYGGTPEGDNAAASRTLLQRAFDETRRVRVGRRALLRWALDEVPAVANDPKPKLGKAALAEGRELAGRDK